MLSVSWSVDFLLGWWVVGGVRWGLKGGGMCCFFFVCVKDWGGTEKGGEYQAGIDRLHYSGRFLFAFLRVFCFFAVV